MNCIKITKSEILQLKYPSNINIINNSNQKLIDDIISDNYHDNIIIFTHCTKKYDSKYFDKNVKIYKNTNILNEVVLKILSKSINEKYLIVFDKIKYIYKDYSIIKSLFEYGVKKEITTVFINLLSNIPFKYCKYLDYVILYDIFKNNSDYINKLYKKYGKVLDNVNIFKKIYIYNKIQQQWDT